jgi:archaetidylinositol phosphate synthase
MIAQTEASLKEGFDARRQPGGFVNASRIHTAITARAERWLLTWIAERMPVGIHPDHLTALGFASQLLAGAAYALASYNAQVLWLVNVFLFLNWLGDSLDGTLAKVRNQQRPRYGFYVDHIADTFGALALMTGLGYSGYIHWRIAAGMLVGFYVLSIESYLTTYTRERFHLSHCGLGPTEVRILLAVGNAVVFIHPYAQIAGRSFLLFDAGGTVAIAGMALMALVAVARNTVALYREETQP